MKRISYSSVNKFHMCPYAYHMDKSKGIRKKNKSRALYIGSTIHELLETYNRGEDWLAHLHAIEDNLTLEEKLNIQEESLLWLEDTIKGYIACYEDDYYDIQQLEYKLECSFKGMKFVGYVDGIVMYKGKLYILERKTSSASFPKEFNLLIREQPYIYAYFVEKLLNVKIAGIIWEFTTSKPLSSIKVKKDGEPYAASLKATPYMWEKEFGDLDDAPETLTYQNVFERTIIPINRKHLKRMVSNFVDKAEAVNVEQVFKKYDSVNCTRMCDYSEWCMYELKNMDPRVLIGTVYEEKVNSTLKCEEVSK